MTTPNMIRLAKIAEVVDAFKRMKTVDEAAIKVAEELAKKKEEEEAV